jgi:hypothetical protein
MAKTFNDTINEIMPLVRDGSDLPFAITREDGKWNINYFSLNTTAAQEEIKVQAASYLAFLRGKDPYAVKYTGADFNDGSLAFVHDKILCARFRAEYNAVPLGEVHGGEFMALLAAVEDNIGSFSQEIIDYLLQFDNPLRELYDLNPIPLWNRDGDNNEPYIEDNVTEFIEAVEYKVGELIKEAEQAKLALSKERAATKKKPVTLEEKLGEAKKKAAEQNSARKDGRGDKPKKRGERE